MTDGPIEDTNSRPQCQSETFFPPSPSEVLQCCNNITLHSHSHHWHGNKRAVRHIFKTCRSLKLLVIWWGRSRGLTGTCFCFAGCKCAGWLATFKQYFVQSANFSDTNRGCISNHQVTLYFDVFCDTFFASSLCLGASWRYTMCLLQHESPLSSSLPTFPK